MLRFIVRTCSNVTHLIAQLRAPSTRTSRPRSEPSLHQSGGPSNREDAQQFSTAASGLSGSVVLEEAEAEYGDLPISDDHKRALLEIRKRKTADLTDEHKENKKQRKKGQMRIVYFFLVKCNFFGLFVHFMWHIYTAPILNTAI